MLRRVQSSRGLFVSVDDDRRGRAANYTRGRHQEEGKHTDAASPWIDWHITCRRIVAIRADRSWRIFTVADREDSIVSTEIPDQTIAHAVQRTLQLDARLTPEAVTVEVHDGVVRLLGYVTSSSERELVRRLAERVRGVRQVIDDLSIVPTTRSDADLTADVVSALVQRPEVDADTIEVVTVDGIVHLRGTVSSETVRKIAEDTARGVDGVLDVVNELLVHKPIVRSEAVIAEDVRRRILATLRIEPNQVAVRVENGVAVLQGMVTQAELRMLADEVARWTPGVLDVRNELAVCSEAA